MGRKIKSKPVSLIKQIYSSPVNLKYKPRGLIAANNVFRVIRKKIFAVFEQYKMSKVQ